EGAITLKDHMPRAPDDILEDEYDNLSNVYVHTSQISLPYVTLILKSLHSTLPKRVQNIAKKKNLRSSIH
ncbi:MAG: hypothetical protein AB2693_27575, partial [Candidatus Thiodiazotropha sp.]